MPIANSFSSSKLTLFLATNIVAANMTPHSPTVPLTLRLLVPQPTAQVRGAKVPGLQRGDNLADDQKFVEARRRPWRRRGRLGRRLQRIKRLSLTFASTWNDIMRKKDHGRRETRHVRQMLTINMKLW